MNAHRSQLTTESHLSKLAEYDDNKYVSLLMDLEKEHEEIKQYENTTACRSILFKLIPSG